MSVLEAVGHICVEDWRNSLKLAIDPTCPGGGVLDDKDTPTLISMARHVTVLIGALSPAICEEAWGTTRLSAYADKLVFTYAPELPALQCLALSGGSWDISFLLQVCRVVRMCPHLRAVAVKRHGMSHVFARKALVGLVKSMHHGKVYVSNEWGFEDSGVGEGGVAFSVAHNFICAMIDVTLG